MIKHSDLFGGVTTNSIDVFEKMEEVIKKSSVTLISTQEKDQNKQLDLFGETPMNTEQKIKKGIDCCGKFSVSTECVDGENTYKTLSSGTYKIFIKEKRVDIKINSKKRLKILFYDKENKEQFISFNIQDEWKSDLIELISNFIQDRFLK